MKPNDVPNEGAAAAVDAAKLLPNAGAAVVAVAPNPPNDGATDVVVCPKPVLNVGAAIPTPNAGAEVG